MADVTFPSLPHVVSLLHYDDAARTPDNLHPPAGYPVICVTVSPTPFTNVTQKIFLNYELLATYFIFYNLLFLLFISELFLKFFEPFMQ